ncbi:hypothetical protein R1flu_002259 [Riccia fluitans]|uniref:Uncharacterized protein n=1 Tax=Riccia fluitans TaxID=41844 RepID=A0ABD1Y9F8_9MARC
MIQPVEVTERLGGRREGTVGQQRGSLLYQLPSSLLVTSGRRRTENERGFDGAERDPPPVLCPRERQLGVKWGTQEAGVVSCITAVSYFLFCRSWKVMEECFQVRLYYDSEQHLQSGKRDEKFIPEEAGEAARDDTSENE